MRQPIIAFVFTGLILLALDLAWLSTMADRFYRPQLGSLMRQEIALAPAIAFYIVYTLSLTTIAVLPAVTANRRKQALRLGLLVGFAAYGTYNLTNAATLNGWPSLLIFIDWSWGTFVSGVTAYLAAFGVGLIGKSPQQRR